MKKFIILLLSFSAATAVFAQSHDRDYDYNQPAAMHNDRDFRDEHRADAYGFDARRAHDEQIAQINREFDEHIAAVQYDRWMWPGAKERQIRRLERERNERLRACDMGFSKSYDRHDDDRYAHAERHGW